MGENTDILEAVKVLAPIVFPENLEDIGRPYVRFSCITPPPEASPDVYLPIPGGLSFADGGAYNTIDMGMIDSVTALANAAIGGAKSGNGVLDSTLKAAEATKNVFMQEANAAGALGAGIIAARRVGADTIAQALELRGKVVKNPKNNTAFGGNNVRAFQFDFKLVGRNKSEVAEIDRIQNVFRNQVYAKKKNAGNLMLQYPNTWQITFHDPDNPGEEMEYIPKIYTCYLLAVSTTINSSSNTYRKSDKSPYEIDISLQFQETKVLTRDDIEALENGNRYDLDQENGEEVLQLAQDVFNLGKNTLSKAVTDAKEALNPQPKKIE